METLLLIRDRRVTRGDVHSRLQKSIVALGMSYSLTREVETMMPEIMLLPTATKIAKMIATGLEILETQKEEIAQNVIQKFQGLINCLSALCLTRIGNRSTKTITAFTDEKNIKRLHKCYGAKRNLDNAVMELVDIAREMPAVALSVIAPIDGYTQ